MARAHRPETKNLDTHKPAEILAFNDIWGGGSGRIAKLNFLNGDKSKLIESPHTKFWKPTDPEEIARLETAEKKALEEIERRFHDNDPPIGAFLLEAIPGAKGVYFYRPEFLLKLRQLCDKIGIPLIADEILTGGGRTGKFFAYQHYEGFRPDFVTVGKGLQVAGVAKVRSSKYEFGPTRVVTLYQHDEALLKSTQILKRIKKDNLMENASTVGKYMVEKIRQQAPGYVKQEDVRGMGALIYAPNATTGITDAKGRLMPPLTITREQVDEVLKRP